MATPGKRMAKRVMDRKIIAEVDAIKKKNRAITEDDLADLIFAFRHNGALKSFKTFEHVVESQKYDVSDEALAFWEAEKEAEKMGKEQQGKVIDTPLGQVSALLHWRAANMGGSGEELKENDVKMVASLVLSNGKVDTLGKNSLEYLQVNFNLSDQGKRLVEMLIEKHYHPEDMGVTTAAKKRKAERRTVDMSHEISQPVVVVEYFDAGGNMYKSTKLDASGKALMVEMRP